jgi:uncharacterized protein YndB with AHSA1/START domain
MTTPDVPLRMELNLELPGTPEQLWAAIATENGITAWFLPTELEERKGGAVTFHMGEDMASHGEVTEWAPLDRLSYAEPDWAAMTGHEGAPVTPMVTEFLIEAKSGGTCSLRVVTSAFGVGADWEQEFFDDMAKHWMPFFDNLRLYMTHFPGQRVTPMSVEADFPGEVGEVWSALVQAMDAREVGQRIEVRGVDLHIERIGVDICQLLASMEAPAPGYLQFGAHDFGELVRASITGYLFSEDAPKIVEHEQARWKAWLEGIAVPAGSSSTP